MVFRSAGVSVFCMICRLVGDFDGDCWAEWIIMGRKLYNID